VKNRKKTDSIVIHCSDTSAIANVGAEEIKHWHVNENDWDDIGYHFVIRRDGTIELGREIDKIGAHAFGLNKYSIGICMVGGSDPWNNPEDNFSSNQYLSLSILVRGLLTQYSGIHTVIGHKDIRGVTKTCPNFDVSAWLAVQGIIV